VLWAGKLDYWLIGSSGQTGSGGPQQTLCRFDGVNLVWEPLSLPAATIARMPINPDSNKPIGGVTSGACYAWNNCWFFGTDGIVVHWDGQALTDASPGLGASPWLQGDFTAAVAGTDPAGNEFGLAVTDAGTTTVDHFETNDPPKVAPALTPDPTTSRALQVFGSQGGPFAPLSFSPLASAHPGGCVISPATECDQFTTDLVAAAFDSQGDVWVAGDPTKREESSEPAPAQLLRLTEQGAQAPCDGYDANTFTYAASTPFPSNGSYHWNALSVFANDGSAVAGGKYQSNVTITPKRGNAIPDAAEPVIVRAACGQQPITTRFLGPDPTDASAPPIPADVGGSTTAVAANAANDAWASTSGGGVSATDSTGTSYPVPQPPHLYRWTDGQPVSAPAGDDNESRPSLFTLGPPAFVIGAPTIVTLPPSVTTTVTKGKTKQVKLKPAIYSVQLPKLRRARDGTYTLYISFRVRRTLMIGLQGLRGRKVVASSGLKRFTPPRGQLALRLDRKHWPTGLRYVFPKGSHG
jgi:hypothetical protein